MPRPSTQRRTLTGTAIAAVVLLTSHYLGLLAPIERTALAVLKPLGRLGVAITHGPNGVGRTASQSERRVAELENRVADLSVENTALRSALTAVTETAAQNTFLKDRKLSGINARIFARSADPASQVIAIDAGTDDGVRIGAPVIIQNGIFIGRIQNASANASHVILTIDNRSSITAVMADNPAAQGVVTGVGGLSLKMELIPQSEELKVGEIAITSGTDANIPPGLTVGELDRFERQEGAVLQTASLRPLYSLARLDAITVLTGISQL